ncbi:hypothetical protein GCM10007924_25180 [Sneathiella chinensis]|uniref:Uncharacterized protein n=1 Tax=Sneathiella chinensis TaxID=349750 RepID=A0ABQ5U5A4_9PROT|nr:hypothetical protein GCM10007924_25180 [Sneathiella chinensis]
MPADDGQTVEGGFERVFIHDNVAILPLRELTRQPYQSKRHATTSIHYHFLKSYHFPKNEIKEKEQQPTP